jgi:hypothetical protein
VGNVRALPNAPRIWGKAWFGDEGLVMVIGGKASERDGYFRSISFNQESGYEYGNISMARRGDIKDGPDTQFTM